MKPLYQYILESHGIVRGEYDWSVTAKYIADQVNDMKPGIRDINRDLPSWMCGLFVEVVGSDDQVNLPNAVAAYSPDSIVKNGKMEVHIMVKQNSNNLQSSIEHELQHAFDDWVAQTKRNRKIFDKGYCIGTGMEFDDLRWDQIDEISTNITKCGCDHVFCLLKQCTYALHESEVNAYLREFDIYLKEKYDYRVTGRWNFDNIRPDADRGMLPLITIDLLHKLRNGLNRLDISDEDWEYVGNGLNMRWTQEYLGHRVLGSGKEIVAKCIDEILKKYGNKAVKRYLRVIKDNGDELINKPYWLK